MWVSEREAKDEELARGGATSRRYLAHCKRLSKLMLKVQRAGSAGSGDANEHVWFKWLDDDETSVVSAPLVPVHASCRYLVRCSISAAGHNLQSGTPSKRMTVRRLRWCAVLVAGHRHFHDIRQTRRGGGADRGGCHLGWRGAARLCALQVLATCLTDLGLSVV